MIVVKATLIVLFEVGAVLGNLFAFKTGDKNALYFTTLLTIR